MPLADLAGAGTLGTSAAEVVDEDEAGEMIAETVEGIEILTLGTEETTPTETNAAENVTVEIGGTVIEIAFEDDDHHLVDDHLPGGISEMRET